MSDEWKWQDEESKEATVIPSVQAVAVYTNPRGEIVIRQESTSSQEDDSVIIIPRQSVNALVKAMKDEAKKPFPTAE